LLRRLFSFGTIFNSDGYIVRRASEASEQTPSEILQQNEGIKWWSNLCGGFGIGLIIAAIVDYVAGGLHAYAIAWIVVACVLLWASRVILRMLEAER
jgi:hypothetical protein